MGERFRLVPNSKVISPALPVASNRRKRKPMRSTASRLVFFRPFRVCRGRRQRSPFFRTTPEPRCRDALPRCASRSRRPNAASPVRRSTRPRQQRLDHDKAPRLDRLGRGPCGRAARPPLPTKIQPPVPHAVGLHAKCRGNPLAGPSSSDSKTARARSASSRSDEPARTRNSARCSALATIHDRPDMFPHMR